MKHGIEEQTFYALTGVIIPVGTTIREGHYFTYVLADGKWLMANDSTITEACWESLRTKNVYMLFYMQL